MHGVLADQGVPPMTAAPANLASDRKADPDKTGLPTPGKE